MTAREPSIVLFDWDGTLCDSGAGARRAFRRSLADFGIAFTDAKYMAVYTPRWREMYSAFDLPRERWEQADQHWLHYYRDERPGLMPGAAEVLRELKEAGVGIGVVTNGTRPRIERELEYMNLAGTFRAVVCHEDVTQVKPDPEGIERALATAACRAEDCWYVGDTAVDIEQGRNAGVFTVGVLTDYVPAASLTASSPHLMLDAIGELPAAIYRLTSTTSSKILGGN